MPSRGVAIAHAPVQPIHTIMTQENSIGHEESNFTASLFLFALGGKRAKFRAAHAQAKLREGVTLLIGHVDGCTRSREREKSTFGFLGEKTLHHCDTVQFPRGDGSRADEALLLGRKLMKRRALVTFSLSMQYMEYIFLSRISPNA